MSQLPPLQTYRGRYVAETPLRLVVGRPPLVRQVQPDDSVLVEEEPAAVLGMTLAGPFLRLLDYSAGMRGALTRWERYCRAKHARWPDHAAGPVCAELAWLTVRDRWGLKGAADELGISYPRAARLLAAAFTTMRTWLVAEERVEDEMGHDRDACPTCRREAVG